MGSCRVITGHQPFAGPEEVAATALFRALDGSVMLNSADIAVDGGSSSADLSPAVGPRQSDQRIGISGGW